MGLKAFHGSLDELKVAVVQSNKVGEWSDDEGNSRYTFRAKSGEILNWWSRTGTLQFQGKNGETFSQVLAECIGSPFSVEPVAAPPSAKIFVVHGHDRNARDQLELILRRLGLEPFILQNSDGGGKTIIEALEQSINRDSTFGIVLLTPDDFGYSKSVSEADRKPRARQNVILEMGMVMAALGRSHMAILQKGVLERPSDTDGILRIEFNDHVREAVPKLVQHLQGAGFKIDAGHIAGASA